MVGGGFEEVREGAALLQVPRLIRPRGPGKRGPEVFFNPTMVVARDLTVAAIAASTKDGDRVLDGMCGTGVMAIRASLEPHQSLQLTFGDWNAASVELTRSNCAANDVEPAAVVLGDVNGLVSRERFDYVDIDPFGSPVPYLDSALRAAADRQVVSATATDLAVLCGAHPAACMRRYGARTSRTPFPHELAVRVLLGHCARTAARYERGIAPLMAAHAEHFVKIWFCVRRGAGRADRALSQLEHLRYDPASGDRRLVDDPREYGPVWSGPFADSEFLRGLRANEWTSSHAGRIIAALREEADAPPLHHTTDEWAKRLRLSPPRLAHFMEALRDAGHQATRTHFHPRGFRTDATSAEVEEIFRSSAP